MPRSKAVRCAVEYYVQLLSLVLICLLFLASLQQQQHLRPSTFSYESDVPDQGKLRSESSSNGVRVLAFTLYGNASRYTDGAIANAKLRRWIYPGWVMQVYHDQSTPRDLLSRLSLEGVHLIDMSTSYLGPMNWRLLAASDEEVDVFCSRDISSRLSIREFSAVSEWLETNFLVHMIRDHPGHIYHPLMEGLWCARGDVILDIRRLLHGYSRKPHFDAEQEFLRDQVWPRVNTSVLQHANFGCDYWEVSRSIPAPRVGLEYVGATYIEHMLRDEDADILHHAISKGEECVRPNSAKIKPSESTSSWTNHFP